jgi:hypothetical protein
MPHLLLFKKYESIPQKKFKVSSLMLLMPHCQVLKKERGDVMTPRRSPS